MMQLATPAAGKCLRAYSSALRRQKMSPIAPMPIRSLTLSSPSQEESSSRQCSHSLLILGKPGGGKGTISGKILADFPQFRHVSTGDELRQHVRNRTVLGIEAKKYMDEGALVPDNVMIKMVMGDAVKAVKAGQSLLLDGFPRTMEQAVALDKSLDVDLVINLCIPNDTIIERISDRWIHPASGRVYSYSYRPPKVKGKDDETGDPLVQRDDDKPESVLKRLQKYEDATAPLVEYYEEKGVIQTFKGTMSDVIYPKVKGWLDEKLAEDEDPSAAACFIDRRERMANWEALGKVSARPPL
mmetsp:Transcript_51940/g.110361  ORF Transcript_51940/g.110361 Transcript_51940/m.110361 type:complete len:299 (-) Transcript_51940:108-1004(-)|eukprot:CAMPEP_0172552244 /NCGR_PEP_ID=MMETSP1067-20121228/43707_1 /TAXON_ID=265564 ORGANISM="Thalassiosira punctigera, Strain Tpunct2005C2" /NCGR_SAMPLE_ID=MMETSP1067 /ASSEMBLY_ACC=CAM_ASM_000444 /LENGTH=298 /DNA_ID=CAMNT_0013340177 /DNA_START=275 /DNA_END=1171 /DNA_ORIENTATION=-